MFSRRVLRAFWPVLLWMAFVFYMSTDLGASDHSSRILVPLLRFFIPDITPNTIETVHFFARKAGHVAEYAVLALLTLRALRILREIPPHRWSWSLAFTAVAIAAAYAVTDELHQWFVPSRGPSLLDVLIDSCGAVLGILAAFVWKRSQRPVPVVAPSAA